MHSMIQCLAKLFLLVLTLAAAGCATSSMEQVENKVYATVSQAKEVNFRYVGSAKVHQRLGNFQFTRDSRVGQLAYQARLVKGAEFDANSFTTSNSVISLNGHALNNNIVAGGQTPSLPLVLGFVYPTSSAFGKFSSISDLVATAPANQPFTKTNRTSVGSSSVRWEYQVVPNARMFTYKGQSLSAALIQKRTFVGSNSFATDEERYYVSDSVPGRVLKVEIQGYMDDGTPGGYSELSLVSATVR